MKTKKWLSLLLALAMAVTLAACSGGQAETPSSGTAQTPAPPAAAPMMARYMSLPLHPKTPQTHRRPPY